MITLSPFFSGFTASELAQQVRTLSQQSESDYGPRRAAYDLKKLRGKQLVRRMGKTAKYEPIPAGLRGWAEISVGMTSGQVVNTVSVRFTPLIEDHGQVAQ